MGLLLVPLHDAITAKVELTLPSTPIEEDTLPDDVMPQRDVNGQMIPYVILRYGPLRKSYGTGAAVGGVRLDDYFGTMDLMTIAPNGRMARRMLDILTDALIGFNPGGGGVIHLEGSASNFVVSSNEARPTQMVCMLRLKFTANGIASGEPLVAP